MKLILGLIVSLLLTLPEAQFCLTFSSATISGPQKFDVFDEGLYEPSVTLLPSILGGHVGVSES